MVRTKEEPNIEHPPVAVIEAAGVVLLSMGMGVDSAAWLTRILLEPDARPFDLSKLIVITAMTGDEFGRTKQAMEERLLPLMRKHGVRYVQVARAGQSETDGIVVLSDSTATEQMVMRGPWALSDELGAAGTLPEITSGNRKCSYRAKGWVLDTWIEANLGDADRVHVIGFAAEEQRRAARDMSYTQNAKTPWYPLIQWGWDRGQCASYLRETYGIDWPRSCCGYCPFQAGPEIDLLAARWREDPAAGVQALLLEHRAMALNPRMRLFGKRTARAVAEEYRLDEVLSTADAAIAAQEHTLYEVRRIFRRKGDHRSPDGRWALGPDRHRKGHAWRSVRTLATEVLPTLQQALRAGTGDLEEMPDGSMRLWLARPGQAYPTTEWYLVIGPAGINDKERAAFDVLWQHTLEVMAALPPEPEQLDLDELFEWALQNEITAPNRLAIGA